MIDQEFFQKCDRCGAEELELVILAANGTVMNLCSECTYKVTNELASQNEETNRNMRGSLENEFKSHKMLPVIWYKVLRFYWNLRLRYNMYMVLKDIKKFKTAPAKALFREGK